LKVVPKGTEEHSKRLRLAWLRRRWSGRRKGRPGGEKTMPLSHKDLWIKIKEETKGKPPAEELRILERHLADWIEFKGPYQEMKKKLERRAAELARILRVQASHHGHRDPFAVKKRGLAEVALVGVPNSGKSTVMRALTGADAAVADYPYTTLTPNIGMLNMGGFALEIVDLPPVSERPLDELSYAAGFRGVLSSAGLLVLVIDLTADPESQLEIIRDRLHEVGVEPAFARAGPAGAPAEFQAKGTIVVATRGDLSDGGTIGELRGLVPEARVFVHPFAATAKLEVAEALCRFLGRIVVMARDPHSREEPLAYAIRSGGTVVDLAEEIHKELSRRAKRARVWGRSARFPGQEVGLAHRLEPGDVVEILDH
jgi:ribosome-interacting GTPase 1